MKRTNTHHTGTLVQCINHARTVRLVLILALIVASMPWLPALPVRAATRTVTTNADSGAGSLRDTLAAASAGDEIVFQASLEGQTITLTSGELAIAKNLTITGPGADKLTISAGDTSRIFNITSGTVSISGLTITKGRAPDNQNGGAILVSGASTNVTITSCAVTDSVNVSNTLGKGGAGIAVSGGSTLTVNKSTLSGNVTDNTGLIGGGILNDGSTVTLNNTTVSGNIGGIAGGGIATINNGTLAINYSTIANNKVKSNLGSYTDGSGGVDNMGTSAVTIQASIIAQNGIGVGNDASIALAADCKGTFTSGGYTIVETLSYSSVTCGWTSGTGDQTGVAARLRPLAQSSYGTMPTLQPAPDSPAVNAIPSGTNSCGTAPYDTDQRGVTRPYAGAVQACEIGAQELVRPEVTSTGDSGAGTLQQAISDVDEGDIITFAESLYGQEIRNGTLSIARSITIEGPGADKLTVSTYGGVPAFSITTPGINVTIRGLTIKNPYAALDKSIHPIVQVESAHVWIDACTITGTDNHNATLPGAGIAVFNSGTLTVSNSLISNNNSENASGGGIAVDHSTLTVIRSTISNNIAYNGDGGGILVRNGGTATISESTISGNKFKSNGGGIAVLSGGTATISKSTISGNEYYNVGDYQTNNSGGGIYSEGSTSTLIINNSTISGNQSIYKGGGIYSEGSLTINYSTIADNYIRTRDTVVPYDNNVGGVEHVGPTPAILQGSILDENRVGSMNPKGTDCKGTCTSQGYNLVNDPIQLGTTECTWTSGTGDQLNVAANLGVLQDNGGPTQTHMPAPRSPARGAIPSGSNGCGTAPYNTDQRGKSRLGTCDMGAVEVSTTLPVTSTADSGVGSLRQAISDTDPDTTITFDAALNGKTITLASQLNIEKELTIQGPGASNLTISGNNTSRVFNVDTSGILSLSGVTVAQGKVSGADQSGAGILTKGNLTLVDSRVMSNTIESVSTGNGGAGIASLGNVTLAITNSTISNNTVTGTGGMGGGIASLNGSRLDIATSTIADNSVAGSGGGIASSGTNAATTIITSTISGNSATGNGATGNGGGVLSSGTNATITVMNSTLSGNSATGNGGGFANGTTSTATVGNSTISGNSASTGGGFFHDTNATALSLNFTTIVSNTASTSGGGIANAHTTNNVVVKNSILAGNAGNTASPDCSGKVELYQDNLLGSLTGCSYTKAQGAFFDTSTTPYLAPLANNGGATWTHLPLPNPSGIVINQIPTTRENDCYKGPPYNTDQRGKPRPAVVGGSCDVGAVELFNDQPIPTSTSVKLAGIELNATNPPGETVANLFGPIYTDENNNPFAGILIYNTTSSTEGSWQYSTDNGQTWAAPATNSSTALLVQPTTKLRFLPQPGYEGIPKNVITAALWDGTTGQVGPMNTSDVSRSADGAYSKQLITLSTTVGSNSPPTGGNDTVTTDEDTIYRFRQTDFTFNDPNLTDKLELVKIVTLPAKGTLRCTNVTDTQDHVAAVGDECAILKSFTFIPGANEYGSPYTSFKFKVGDAAGAYSTDEYVMTINVTPVDEPPTIVSTGMLVFIQTSVTISSSSLSATDDTSGPDELVYSLTQPPILGILSKMTTPLLMQGSTFTQRDIDRGLISYKNGSYGTETSDSFSFSVTDKDGMKTGGTFRFIIAKTDSEMSLTSFTRNITEDTALAFTPLDFTAHINHTSSLTVENILIMEMPKHGTLWLGANQVALWQTIPITAITTLVYSPTLNYDGSDAFMWNAGTVNGYAKTGATVTVAMTPTNDPPVLLDINKTGPESTSIPFTQQDFTSAFTDVDSLGLVAVKIVSLPDQGRLLLSDAAVGVDQVIPLADLGNLVFVPDTGWNGVTSLLWNASDGTTYATTDSRINIFINNNNSPTNKPPVLSDIRKTGQENTSVLFTQQDFTSAFTDVDSLGLVAVKIVSLPDHGRLLLSGTAVGTGQVIPVANLGNLVFVPDTDWNGTTSLLWNASDGTTYATTDSRINIIIISQNSQTNDPPVLSDISKTGSENTSMPFTQQDFTSAFADVDSLGLVAVKIVSLPNHGRLLLGSAAVGVGQVIPVADLGNLVFVPDTGWHGVTSLLWNASDGITYATTDSRINIFISSNKNDAPIVADITRQGMEDTPIVLSASELVSPPNFVELDEDDGLETLKIVSLPQHGTLNNGSTPVQAGQEIARANLVNLTFVPEANWSGNTSFAWNASDGETYAASDAQVKLTILAVNDPPVLTNIAMQTSVNTPITLDSSLFSQHYTDVENSSLATIRIVTLPTNGSLYLNGAIVQRYQEINRTALDTLSFQPADDWSGTTTLTWNASDGQAYAQNAATLTIAVRSANAPPTDLLLSNQIIATSAPADTVVGTLTALDANDGDTQSFAMVDGAGSDDNARFAIRGNELRTATAMDATTPTRLRVRIQATDSYGASIERAFSIIVSSEPLATVTGQVVHADNASAVVQAVVTARAVRDDGRVDIGGIAQDAFTDKQGIFTMKLPVGSSYEVFVRSLPVGDAADYYVSDTPATFTLQAGTSEKTLDPIRVPRAVKQIVGTVSYSTTQGVAGATVKATNNDTAIKKYAKTNASGQYTITVSGGTWTVALMPPGNGDMWTSNELPQTVTFAQAAEQAEVQRADFAAQQAIYFITGRILGADGKPLVLLPGQQELGIILWDMTNQREIIVYLQPDGTFRIPVSDGSVYRIRGWVDHRQRPDMRLPDIAPREITGSSLNLGSISLVRLQATITGRVTGRDGAGMPGVTVAAWKGQTQFSARSDNDGFYTIRVPYGAWSVSPDVGNLATASFLYEGVAKKVVVSKREDTAQATFIVSRAGASVYGTVIDETGSLVDARLFVGIVRLNRTAPAIVVPVVDGTFALRVPENCATCTYRATAGENNAYSVVAGSENPRIETQPDGTQHVVYTVRMDTGSVVGRLRNAKTGQPVSGVRGTATLRNANNSYATAIQPDGSYQFEHVADGNYTLSYELERAPGHVLAHNDYVPFPLQPQTLTVRNGVVVPSQRSTSLQAGSGDANVTNGTSFTVQTKTSCATTQATDSTTATLRAYPVTVVCEFANGTIRNFSCEAQPDDTSMCYKPDVSPSPTCSVITGEAAGNNAVDSTPGNSVATSTTGDSADVGAVIGAILAETGDVEQVRAYLHGEHVLLASSHTSVYLARRPHKQANPRRTKLGAETERDGAVVELQDRQRDTYMFGMLRGPDGAYIRDYPVAVMAAAGGNDGQVRTVDTTEGYYLFEIAQSRDSWTITASMDKDGKRYRATATVHVAQLVKNGTVFVPDMTLVEVGAVPPAASQSFDSAVGTQMTLTATDESQDTPMLAATSGQAITVDVPPGAVSADTSDDVRITLEPVAVVSTGMYRVLGDGYRITLSDRNSGRVLVEPLDTPIIVTLPYDNAALAAAGSTAEQLQVATFSDDSLAWTPLAQSSVDTAARVVRVQREQTTDVIALVVPVQEPQTARGIASTGKSSQLTFVIQDGSTITSTLEVPAGLTVQPGASLAATTISPVAVVEVQITAPVKHGQQLAAGSVLIGGFTVDLLDEHGDVIPQGHLSQPLQLTLRFEDARVPTGAIMSTTRADAFTTALSAWVPTTLVQDAQASPATAGVSTIVATSDVAGQFAVVASDHTMLYLPMVMR